MNVLVFTSTILMLLAMITYARIEMYVNFKAVESQFEGYMANALEAYVNIRQKQHYMQTPVSTKDAVKEADREQAEGSSKLSVRVYVNKKERDVTVLAATTTVLKNLLFTMYQEQPFFREALNERPDFIDEILVRIMFAVDNGEVQIEEIKDLANINLQDSELQQVYYKMLHGNVRRRDPAEKRPLKPDEGEYYPLLDYLTLSNKTKIRVYLAPYTLLEAIFGTPQLANQVIDVRQNLYRDLDLERITKEQGKDELRSLFLGQRRENITEALLDFSISKTNPKDYNLPR